MSFSWNTKSIASILNLTAPRELAITSITTDSRAVTPGALFIAIKGDTHDGHAFIPQAIEKGAVAILSETSPTPSSVIQFQVPSTLDAIRKLAYAYRKSFSVPFIAVVGAVGKTTTKEMISSILQGKYKKVLKTEGSQNGYLGIPLTLLNLKADTEIAVIEIGIDDIGAMKQHLELVEPTQVILTKIGPEHLHQLKTLEIAAEEELKAFDYALAKQIPMAINLSDSYVAAWLKKQNQKISLACTYSLNSADQPEFLGVDHPSEQGLEVLRNGSPLATFKTPLPGTHHAHNLLAAISLCSFFNLSVEELKKGLSHFKTATGRTEIYHSPQFGTLIGDHYNSNPTSLEAAILLLTSEPTAGKYHAALGDMLELGEWEERFHREMAAPIIKSKIQHLWLYGPRMKWLQDELKKQGFSGVEHFENHAELTKALKKHASSKDRILVKGSRGMKMEKVLSELREGSTP